MSKTTAGMLLIAVVGNENSTAASLNPQGLLGEKSITADPEFRERL